MRELKSIKGLMWKRSPLDALGIRSALYNLPSGLRCNIIVGEDEDGWEHVSVELCARRLPTYSEMQHIKELFWDDEEMVVQIHPKKSEYVNITEALHLWRPKDGDWSMLNRR